MYVSVYADWFWTGLKDAAGFWRGLKDVSIDATAKSPGIARCRRAVPDVQPVAARHQGGRLLQQRSLDRLELRSARASNAETGKLGPPDPRKLDHCFASFMLARLSRSDLPTGFDGFRSLIGDPRVPDAP